MTRITKNDESGLIQVVTWFLLSVSVCAWIMRTMVKTARKKKPDNLLDLDDYFVLSAMLSNIFYSISIGISASRGLGKPASNIDHGQLNASLKASFAADILYISCLCFAKWAVIALLVSITPNRRHRQAGYSVGAVITLWAFIGIFTVAFQCHVPHTWDFLNNHCIDRNAFWTYFELLNIFTDVTLVALPLVLIFGRSQLSMTIKLGLSLPFTARFSISAACICKIFYWLEPLSGSDSFFTLWPTVICTELIQCLSIISICLVYIKQFINSLETGFMGNDELLRRGETESYGLGSTPSRPSSSKDVLTQCASSPGTALQELSTESSKDSTGKRRQQTSGTHQQSFLKPEPTFKEQHPRARD